MQPFSILDLFKVGIGPSSSHTLGPMRAAERFAQKLSTDALLTQVVQIRVSLYGSLALTGVGHSTDKAVILGLSGLDASTVDPNEAELTFQKVKASQELRLNGEKNIRFDPNESIRFFGDIFLPEHPNGLRFCALDEHGIELEEQTWYSVGGGAIANELAKDAEHRDLLQEFADERPYPFVNAKELMEHCVNNQLSIAEVAQLNEAALQGGKDAVTDWVESIVSTMTACMNRGLTLEGPLPGGINVQRRAKRMADQLKSKEVDEFSVMDWVSVYALAVNEENAAGGRVVTAPTNGSAGVIPAVLLYLENHRDGLPSNWHSTFLLTCAVIGWLYKRNASISAAEMGCQGEIGVASSMAAAGMAAILGGTPEQVEHAAEIAMEHHLGMTCDPIAGLVQVPCIERNAFGAIKAIQAARLSLSEPGDHCVSLDECIETMRQTGEDMVSKYKETAQGGLAVNVVVC
ncbi:L-serine ammonia-lyase [Reinekea marina]|uniref:L-serine dehydratase n=1 Tax=Reinekea marina TaxID=1310421 RepID=A0ABV7WRS1_9GAMM|nr:L-serine ammonia-lyase [Reinekea marina]MDN3648237.1 L-serine ammonia-lyase [Reinekea marina]